MARKLDDGRTRCVALCNPPIFRAFWAKTERAIGGPVGAALDQRETQKAATSPQHGMWTGPGREREGDSETEDEAPSCGKCSGGPNAVRKAQNAEGRSSWSIAAMGPAHRGPRV